MKFVPGFLLSFALCVSGCKNTPEACPSAEQTCIDASPTSAQPEVAATPPQRPGRTADVIGVWFDGLPDPQGGRGTRIQTIGVYIISPVPGESGCSAELLASGEIVGIFRSAREAWWTRDNLMSAGKLVRWYLARYDNDLAFVEQEPPRFDKYDEDGEFRGWPIGELDAGLSDRSVVWFLPPPLQDRGVAVVIKPNGLHNSLRTVLPQDVSTSVTVSWGDYDRRVAPRWAVHVTSYVEGVPVREDWATSQARRKKSGSATPGRVIGTSGNR